MAPSRYVALRRRAFADPEQHNMAKVYSGLHEAAGHIVPYIVRSPSVTAR